MSRSFFSRPLSVTSWLLTEMRLSAEYVSCVGGLLGFGRQVDVDALLGQVDCGHEDDEQHE
jgi:hypothetical protein